jgi:hypothetical protein
MNQVLLKICESYGVKEKSKKSIIEGPSIVEIFSIVVMQNIFW